MSLLSSGLRLRMPKSSQCPTISFDVLPGARAFIVSPPLSIDPLILTFAGALSPKRGEALVFGEPPYSQPQLRAQIASVLLDEPGEDLGQTGTVASHLHAVSELRAAVGIKTEAATALLSQEFCERSFHCLSTAELRLVALELALTLASPKALLLAEPLRDLSLEQQQLVLELLAKKAQGGAVVASFLAAERQAHRLAETAIHLPRESTLPPPKTRLLLSVERPREIAAILAAHPAVHGTRLDEQRPQSLMVDGTDADGLIDAATAAISRSRMDVFEMTLLPPGGSNSASNSASSAPSKSGLSPS